jgi:8-amino-7-oxononanoate synthase
MGAARVRGLLRTTYALAQKLPLVGDLSLRPGSRPDVLLNRTTGFSGQSARVAYLRRLVERRMADRLGLSAFDSGKGPTIFGKCALTLAELEPLLETGNYSRVLESVDGAKVTMGGREYVSFSRCDYLGLTSHPRVRAAITEAVAKYGPSVSSSRLAAGTLELHEELEKRMAEFMGREACIVYMMGYLANLAAIPALVGKGEYVVVDKKSHASIVDACALAQKRGASVEIYQHNDMAHLEEKLKDCGYENNKLIVTDGVFSMDGDIARVDEIQRLAKQYNAGVMVDDAHGLGVLGKSGAGTLEQHNLQGEIDLVMVTLSKAFPGLGGCIIGKKEIIDYLKFASRPYIFNLSLLPPLVAEALTVLDVMKDEPGLRQKLWDNVNYMKKNLARLGFNIGRPEAAIISVIIGSDKKTNQMTKLLARHGFFVDPMIHPAVAKGEAMIRLVITAAHSSEDLAGAIKAFEISGKELGIIH